MPPAKIPPVAATL